MAEHLLARGTVAENHREAFGGQRRRGRAAGRECHGEEDGGTVAENHREAFAGQGCCSGAPSGSSHCRKGRKSHCWKGEILLERRTTAGKDNHCRKGEPLPERRATARKVRKGVPLPARRDCMEQRVGLFF